MTTDEMRSVSLLCDVKPQIIERCLAQNLISVRRYEKGATVHQQRDACEVLDVVLSGGLVAYSLSENGSAVMMFEFGQSSVIGANLLFGDSRDYPLNIYCMTPCEIMHISKKAVEDLLRDYVFVMRFIQSLSKNSQGMNRKITMLTQRTLTENILDYLKQQAVVQGSDKVVLPISKKEFADYLGVQRPSLFRALKKLKEEGIIEIDNRSISLLH